MLGLLQDDVLLHIFGKLDHGRDVATAMCVCRRWRRIVTTHKRAKLATQGTLYDAWMRAKSQHGGQDAFSVLDGAGGHRACMQGKREHVFFGLQL